MGRWTMCGGGCTSPRRARSPTCASSSSTTGWSSCGRSVTVSNGVDRRRVAAQRRAGADGTVAFNRPPRTFAVGHRRPDRRSRADPPTRRAPIDPRRGDDRTTADGRRHGPDARQLALRAVRSAVADHGRRQRDRGSPRPTPRRSSGPTRADRAAVRGVGDRDRRPSSRMPPTGPASPSPISPTCWCGCTSSHPRLWERRPSHADAFVVPIGWGDEPWQPSLERRRESVCVRPALDAHARAAQRPDHGRPPRGHRTRAGRRRRATTRGVGAGRGAGGGGAARAGRSHRGGLRRSRRGPSGSGSSGSPTPPASASDLFVDPTAGVDLPDPRHRRARPRRHRHRRRRAVVARPGGTVAGGAESKRRAADRADRTRTVRARVVHHRRPRARSAGAPISTTCRRGRPPCGSR